MTTRYCGPGGNNGNSGLTWALRKADLNGVEDTPVVAGDVCHIGPGVYREQLTVDVSGGAGTEITYIADVTGEHTDGVGGIVRVTGSDDDQTPTRNNCIASNGKNYRTFRGFALDTTDGTTINMLGSPTNWIIEDCSFQTGTYNYIDINGASQDSNIVRRCMFLLAANRCIDFISTETLNANTLIENCMFIGPYHGVIIDDVGGVTVRNCAFLGQTYAIYITDALGAGFTAVTVNNCIFQRDSLAMRAVNLGEIVEDYNTLFANATDRTNVAVGANSVAYPSLFLPALLHAGPGQVSGFKFPWWFGDLSEWSQVRAITGSNEPSVDLWGNPRPATASKNSWGAVQFVDAELESTTVQAGSYGRVINDAGSKFVRRVLVDGTQITVTIYVRRGANYAGNAVRMTIKQPGQADRTTNMTAAVDTWEQLSDTLTPATNPGFVDVYVESRNTAVAGNYAVFYDTMDVL